MSRAIELTNALNALLDEAKADPNPDEATKAERSARAGALMEELTAELQAQTAALNAEAERMRADTARMNREAELFRWKTAQMEDLVARAERGELTQEEAEAELLTISMLSDADGLED
ncbi:MAG: hypothetical protein IPO67_07800 [Deltaproteobacteria bacterium]|nr:hypothetical protein [Deltaproteobacteria bacterium]MBK9645038.1 hypothetical protein [Deltaproteobacteria bacterium]